MRRRKAELMTGFAAIGLLATGLVSTTSASGEDVADGVPDGFVPRSTTWTSATSGKVLGSVPCDDWDICISLLSTDDGGQTWTERPTPIPTIDNGGGEGVFEFTEAGDKSTGLIQFYDGFDYESLYATYDDGETWQQVSDEDLGLDENSSLKWIGDAVTTTSHVYLIAGVDISLPRVRVWLYRSPIGESDWERVTPPINRAWALYVRDDTLLAHAVVDGTEPKLWASSGASSWTEGNFPCTEIVQNSYLLTVAGSNQVTALCDIPKSGSDEASVHVSADGGTTFDLTGTTEGEGIDVNGDLAAIGDTVTIGRQVDTSSGASCVIDVSSDGGRTWEQALAVPNDGDTTKVTDLEFVDADTGTAVCHEGRDSGVSDVYRTTDGGHTWQALGL